MEDMEKAEREGGLLEYYCWMGGEEWSLLLWWLTWWALWKASRECAEGRVVRQLAGLVRRVLSPQVVQTLVLELFSRPVGRELRR